MNVELDHVAIAVSSLEKGIAFYGDLLGLVLHGTEEVKEQKVKAALMLAGDERIELLEPTAQDSPVAKHIARRGEGLHHIAFRTPDIEAALARLKAAGAELIDRSPRTGVGGSRIAFIHPKSSSGVLIELVESA